MKDTRRNPDGTLTVGIIEENYVLEVMDVDEPKAEKPVDEPKPEFKKMDEDMPLAEQITLDAPKPAPKPKAVTPAKRKTPSKSKSSKSKAKTKK